MMTLVDTHCHLDLAPLAGDISGHLARARHAGVRAWIVPAVSEASWDAVADLAIRHHGVLPALGVHPWHAGDVDDRLLVRLASACKACGAVAVGEIGLDRVAANAPIDIQARALRGQLEVAADLGLPVILHVRDALLPLIRTIREAPNASGGVLHAFTGSVETAREVSTLGLYVALGGAATRRRSTRLRMRAAQLPADRILLETDAPAMPPEGVQRTTSEPADLLVTAKALAGIRAVALSTLAQSTTANALGLFGDRLRVALDAHDGR